MTLTQIQSKRSNRTLTSNPDARIQQGIEEGKLLLSSFTRGKVGSQAVRSFVEDFKREVQQAGAQLSPVEMQRAKAFVRLAIDVVDHPQSLDRIAPKAGPNRRARARVAPRRLYTHPKFDQAKAKLEREVVRPGSTKLTRDVKITELAESIPSAKAYQLLSTKTPKQLEAWARTQGLSGEDAKTFVRSLGTLVAGKLRKELQHALVKQLGSSETKFRRMASDVESTKIYQFLVYPDKAVGSPTNIMIKNRDKALKQLKDWGIDTSAIRRNINSPNMVKSLLQGALRKLANTLSELKTRMASDDGANWGVYTFGKRLMPQVLQKHNINWSNTRGQRVTSDNHGNSALEFAVHRNVSANKDEVKELVSTLFDLSAIIFPPMALIGVVKSVAELQSSQADLEAMRAAKAAGTADQADVDKAERARNADVVDVAGSVVSLGKGTKALTELKVVKEVLGVAEELLKIERKLRTLVDAGVVAPKIVEDLKKAAAGDEVAAQRLKARLSKAEKNVKKEGLKVIIKGLLHDLKNSKS